MNETDAASNQRHGLSNVLAKAGILLLLLAFLALLAYGMVTREPLTGASGSTRPGKPAPDFELALFDGGTVSLSDLRGTGVVMNFWASWCPPCRTEMPALNASYAAHKDQGVVFVGVDIWNQAETEEQARAFVEEFAIQYPVGREARGAPISLDYGVSGLPSTFFIDAQGLVLRRWVGPMDLERLDSFVAEIVPPA